MQLKTTRFDTLDIDANGILRFPDGLVGLEAHRHWVLLRGGNETVGWLQSIHAPDVALPVVTPLRLIDGYQLRFHRSELSHMPWSPQDESLVLAIVNRQENIWTANLKAPVIINLRRGLGRQVITCDDQPLQFEFSRKNVRMRKSA